MNLVDLDIYETARFQSVSNWSQKFSDLQQNAKEVRATLTKNVTLHWSWAELCDHTIWTLNFELVALRFAPKSLLRLFGPIKLVYLERCIQLQFVDDDDLSRRYKSIFNSLASSIHASTRLKSGRTQLWRPLPVALTLEQAFPPSALCIILSTYTQFY